jgi:hypothetical protein
VQRRLGKAVRDGLTAETVRIILESLDRVDLGDPFPETHEGRRDKAAALAARLDGIEDRLTRNERKRNERRLRNLRDAYLATARAQPSDPAHCLDDAIVAEGDADRDGWSDELEANAFFERMFEGGYEERGAKVVQLRTRQACPRQGAR